MDFSPIIWILRALSDIIYCFRYSGKETFNFLRASGIKFPFLILIYKTLACMCVSVCPSVHADFSVSLGSLRYCWYRLSKGTLYSEFHAICTPSRNFTQFSRNFIQFWAIQEFLGQFQHVGYKKAYTRAEKFIGGIGRGHRPQEGAEGPKEEAEGLQTGPKAP